MIATLTASNSIIPNLCRMLRHQLLDTSRGRIVTLLQRGDLTADEIAVKLGLTANAIRAQLTAMERDGVIRRAGRRPGTTRPSHVFQLTPEVEQLLSRAYIPLLTQLVDVFAKELPEDQLNGLMRDAGRGLAEALSTARSSSGALGDRVAAASTILNEQLGALTTVEPNGGYIIRGAGCPLSAVTGKHRAVCRAMESLVTTLVGAPAHECCDRANRPRCCFEIES
jgi:DeoR family suf operon transcriptional repressor